jgi:hypothetical protein
LFGAQDLTAAFDARIENLRDERLNHHSLDMSLLVRIIEESFRHSSHLMGEGLSSDGRRGDGGRDQLSKSLD